MTYKATQRVVRRVMPLLERLASRTIDRARLLQYLSARAGEDWGVLDLVDDSVETTPALGATTRLLIFRDRLSGSEHQVRYPACLDESLEPLLLAEYKLLATDGPLSLMTQPLFDRLYTDTFCCVCRWRGPAYEQFHRECRFARYPVNYEPLDD